MLYQTRWFAIATASTLGACAGNHPPDGGSRPVRPAVECAEELAAFAADSGYGEYRPPHVLRMVVPETTVRGELADLWMRVATNGRVDSLVIAGTTNEAFIAALRRMATGYRYRPATVNDCAVVGWSWSRVETPPR